MLTSKEWDKRASGRLNSPILAAGACFAGLCDMDQVMKLKPNPDQHGTARKLARRIPCVPCGFVNLMVPFRCSPAIQRATKVHTVPQTTGHALPCA